MKKIGIVAIVFSILFLFLSGCKGKEKAGTGEADYGARVEGPNYWLAKSDKPVELHVVNTEQSNFMPGDDTTKNEWTRGFKRDLNVDIITDWISPGNQYTTKLNLAIASGELPDVFYVLPSQFKQLTDADMTLDLAPYIENNASDLLKLIMSTAENVTNTAKKDGKLLGMPRYGYGEIFLIDGFWIRSDWLRESGKDAPKTIAELEELFQIFMKQHPGAYGFPLVKFLWEFNQIGAAAGVYPGQWIKAPNGSVIFGSVQPEMKTLLALFADWYKKGYIRKDFMSQDAESRQQDWVAGKCGIAVQANHWGGSQREIIENNGKEAYFLPYEFPSLDGSPVKYPVSFDNWAYIVVNKNSKAAAAALKCMSYTLWVFYDAIAQGSMTQEDVEKFVRYGAGEHTFQCFGIGNPAYAVDALEWVNRVVETGQLDPPPKDMSYLNRYTNAMEWAQKGSVLGLMSYFQFFSKPSANLNNLKIYQENRIIRTALQGIVPEEANNYSAIYDALSEGFTKIIIGEKPIVYFDELVAVWRSTGGDTLTELFNGEFGGKP